MKEKDIIIGTFIVAIIIVAMVVKCVNSSRYYENIPKQNNTYWR